MRPGMGWNRTWYALIWLLFILYWVIPVGKLEWELLATIHRRWTWAALLSPAADTFFPEMLGAFFVPMLMLLNIPTFFDTEHPAHSNRFLFSGLTVLGAGVSCFIVLTLMWGSFPLDVDANHMVHLRMIPFIPWPDAEFLTFR